MQRLTSFNLSAGQLPKARQLLTSNPSSEKELGSYLDYRSGYDLHRRIIPLSELGLSPSNDLKRPVAAIERLIFFTPSAGLTRQTNCTSLERLNSSPRLPCWGLLANLSSSLCCGPLARYGALYVRVLTEHQEFRHCSSKTQWKRPLGPIQPIWGVRVRWGLGLGVFNRHPATSSLKHRRCPGPI